MIIILIKDLLREEDHGMAYFGGNDMGDRTTFPGIIESRAPKGRYSPTMGAARRR